MPFGAIAEIVPKKLAGTLPVWNQVSLSVVDCVLGERQIRTAYASVDAEIKLVGVWARTVCVLAEEDVRGLAGEEAVVGIGGRGGEAGDGESQGEDRGGGLHSDWRECGMWNLVI